MGMVGLCCLGDGCSPSARVRSAPGLDRKLNGSDCGHAKTVNTAGHVRLPDSMALAYIKQHGRHCMAYSTLQQGMFHFHLPGNGLSSRLLATAC
jgi:hypothetical protein